MHRISDNRMGGASRRNFRVFRKLCGESSLKNVVVTTNMWSDPPTEVELAREQELKSSDLCFEPILSKGARTARYIRGQGIEGARDIIRMFMTNAALPVQLQLDQEEGLSLDRTAAGQVLGEELTKLVQEQDKEIAEVQEEMQDEYIKQDAEARKELEEYKRQAEKQLTSIQAQLDRLKQELISERETREKMEEAYREENRKHREEQASLKERIEHLKKEGENAKGNGRNQWEDEMRKTKESAREKRVGFWEKVGKYLGWW